MIRVVNERTGAVLADRARAAANPWQRLRGLIGEPALQPGDGFIITPCQGVHTWFMRAPIDVLLLDRAGRVVHAAHGLAPFRRSPVVWRAHTVVELPGGGAHGTQVGDVVRLERNGR